MATKFYGTGHRKTSIAKVVMVSGKGKITVNGKDVNEYFELPTQVLDLKQPLEATNTVDKFDIEITVNGGGKAGQAGAGDRHKQRSFPEGYHSGTADRGKLPYVQLCVAGCGKVHPRPFSALSSV